MSPPITILVDGRTRIVPAPCTLASLLVDLDRAADAVATAVNGDFVAREERASCRLSDGDSVVCIQLIVGG